MSTKKVQLVHLPQTFPSCNSQEPQIVHGLLSTSALKGIYTLGCLTIISTEHSIHMDSKPVKISESSLSQKHDMHLTVIFFLVSSSLRSTYYASSNTHWIIMSFPAAIESSCYPLFWNAIKNSSTLCSMELADNEISCNSWKKKPSFKTQFPNVSSFLHLHECLLTLT